MGGRAILKLAILALMAIIPIELAPRTALGSKRPAQPANQVPTAVVDALAAGDINGAIIAMREEKISPKLMYLMHNAGRINDSLTAPKPKRADAHETYQNVAISYHNLYLFLKARGIEQREYARHAHSYYRKARAAGTMLHKADCDVLDAALAAASGDVPKAQKKFSKIDETSMRGDFESEEYLAAYYAATGDAAKAVEHLESAYRMKPGAMVTWLAIGDDFAGIADDPGFKALVASWKTGEAERKLRQILPRAAKASPKARDEAGSFRPQKSMPHYDLKKNKSMGKKKGVAKGAKTATKKGKSAKKKR